MASIVTRFAPKVLKGLTRFGEHLATLPDTRDPRGLRHPQSVLLGTLIVALAGGANNIAAVVDFARDHRDWFRLWLPVGKTMPERDTYQRLVRRLDAAMVERTALWLLEGTSGLEGLQELVLAMDGKVSRRTGDAASGLRPLHMVSAFLVREGLTVAQEPCATKSNEIPTFPALLERIALENTVVTIDAAGCQRAIAQALHAGGGDYLLALKRNQKNLHRNVKAAFDAADRGEGKASVTDACETVEHNGGRRERRICTVLGGLGAAVADPAEWPGLRSLIRVQSERKLANGRRQRSVRHCISSRAPQAADLLALVRGHWRGPSGWENGLHRTLDVQFREDDCRIRTGRAPVIMAILRRMALNMLHTIQLKGGTHASIGALRGRIGRQPWILAEALP